MAWIRALVAIVALAYAPLAPAPQPIPSVDFRPFSDGMHWIVRQPLTYTIGVSQDSVTVPAGFVTDFASIPQALQSIIRANGPYILPAVVHDYLYWIGVDRRVAPVRRDPDVRSRQADQAITQ